MSLVGGASACPKMPLDEPIRVVPDWVCEILSPTTRRHDLLIELPSTPRWALPTTGSSISMPAR
jgi:hypothetical protein